MTSRWACGVQMVDLPTGSDGLGWIISHDSSQLLLIPNLHPASIVAAAAGDELALAYVRSTAQQHVACPEDVPCTSTPLDTVCAAACNSGKDGMFYEFYSNLEEADDPQIAIVFLARHAFTTSLLRDAAKEGELAAVKCIHAICPQTQGMKDINLVRLAASYGHLDLLKYACLHPRLQQIYIEDEWNMMLPLDAAKHLDCIKWLLSEWRSLDLYYIEPELLRHVARHHGLSLLEWCSESCELPDGVWDKLPIDAAATANRPMLEWLRMLEPPVPWGPEVCEAAAKDGTISTLAWLRCQEPPCPWDATATAAAAAANDIDKLQWLRAQDPPCPWDHRCCEAAARAGRLDILMCLRGSRPPCPWTDDCADGAARQPTLEIVEWMHEHGFPFGIRSALAASRHGNLPMLQWLHSQGCPLHPDCLLIAATENNECTPLLEWLYKQGCIPTDDLYFWEARAEQSHIWKFLHSKSVPLPHQFGHAFAHGMWLPKLMFLTDIGIDLPQRQMNMVTSARKAHCTFHGLVRWCRRAVSDPSRGAHQAFDSIATNTSGQVLLSRLSMLPSELLNKIAVAADLQHDIFSM